MESNISNIKTSFTDINGESHSQILQKKLEQANIDNKEKVLNKVNIQNSTFKEVNDSSLLDTKSIEEQDKELLAAIETVVAFIEPQIRNVNFTQDESSGKTVVKVFDAESQELIKQFPSKEVLELAEKIKGLQNEIVNKTGILIDDKV